MKFPLKYQCLNNNVFSEEEYSIVPIRYEDRLDIMKWRNEQIYHLRQRNKLTKKDQENYFRNVVSNLFTQVKPSQLLFSFLKNGNCIGYGGLVHIDWENKNSEISFIMNTNLEKKYFEKYWSIYLNLIEQLAFKESRLDSIFTYAYDLRPKLYSILNKNGFKLKEILKDKISINDISVDVYIHQKNKITIRDAIKSDVYLLYEWANDKLVREQSFQVNEIKFDEHIKWFNNKISDKNSILYILEVQKKPFCLIRFDITKKAATIGISIDKTYRGKGLAVKALELGCKRYFNNNNKDILAYIKKKNFSSVKSFERAGFTFSKETEINGIPSVLYKLKVHT
ncbi:MAG: GNAT family N-acetyltransferase [Flavobacteriales bacterium]|nr:GNAT family N-acetyltransferase [Flavobacteriales bacterium]